MRKDQLKFLARLGIWGGVAFLILLRYFDVNPIPYEPDTPEEIPEEAPTRTTGEVLVLVDNKAIAKANEKGSFKAADWSYAWINTVEQEIGPYTLMDRSQLATVDLTPFRYLIVTHSLARNGDPNLVTQLKSYANLGGVLIIERPDGALREAFAADGKAGKRRPKVITNIKDLGKPFTSHMKSMPLNTTYIGSSGPLAGATTWIAMDGVPVVYSKETGRGHVVVVDFNYGLLLTSLQQGRPRDDFSVANRYPDVLLPALEANDLATDERMLDNPVPYADLVEKFIVGYVLGHARPVVGLWPFKNKAQGALLMTHDEEMMGDKSTWMATWEKERGVTSTYFIIPTEAFTSAGVRTLRQSGVDIQLHWNRPQEGQGLYDPVGVWKVNPLSRARSLGTQREDLGTLAGNKDGINANRNHYLLWSDDYTGVFRQLVAEGISIDSTYGPDKGCRGYLFGTGLPFYPIEPKTGLPMPIIEIPFLTAETLGGVDMQFMHRLFIDSYDQYHEAIGVLFHPNAYRWMPSVELFDLWLSTYDLAEDYHHWITSMAAFGRFWRQRREAKLNTSVRIGRGDKKGSQKGDAILAKPPSGYDPGPITITIEAEVAEDGHSAYVPESIRGRTLREVRTGAHEESDTKGNRLGTGLSNVIGRRVRLVSLKKGYNTITAHYR